MSVSYLRRGLGWFSRGDRRGCLVGLELTEDAGIFFVRGDGEGRLRGRMLCGIPKQFCNVNAASKKNKIRH